MTDHRVLCVDLDGSLIRSDLLHESVLLLAKTAPWRLLALPWWLLRGKATLKARIADRVAPQAALLPYNESLLEWLRTQRAAGRRLVLCTASDERYARQVAEHLGIFDDVLATDGRTNLSAERKAAALVGRFGKAQYDYVGNAAADVPVWAGAARAVVVGGRALQDAAGRVAEVERSFPLPGSRLRAWMRGLRPHQWLKNILLFLPLLGAHRWGDAAALAKVATAFLAFGGCASAVYIVNDLFDLESDRQHPRKRLRPFASGLLPIPAGVCAAAALLACAFVLALSVSLEFTEWLFVYLVATQAYTFGLKAIALVDCLMLAGLYTLRVVAGGAAIAQPVSFWLLAFCLFLFLSLAFLKRFAELTGALARGTEPAKGRGYRVEDRQLLQSFGVTSGMAAALVLALYLNSDTVLRLYGHPDRLWFTLPALLFWICWMWLRAARAQMHDDPVVFAVRDRASLVAGALFLLTIWFAK